MKDPGHSVSPKATSVFWGSAFLVGACLKIYETMSVQGLDLGAALSGLAYLPVLGAGALLFLGFFDPRLLWLQPLVFLTLSAYSLWESHDSYLGLGFFVVASVTLSRLGFFDRRRRLRIGYLGAIFLGSIVAGTVRSEVPFPHFVYHLFFFLVLLGFFYLVFRERLVVYLKEPRQKVRLSEKGLSPAEEAYLLALLGGKSPKEVAYDFGIADSTVRNTLSRAYQKLGVDNYPGLVALSKVSDIVP